MQDTYWNIQPNKKLAISLAKREISSFVYNAVHLEGINYTLAEVQTLLQGVTVGGKTLYEQQVVINQSNAWQELFYMLEKGTFELSKNIACKLHKIAGKKDSLTWGDFRNTQVSISGTDYMPPRVEFLDMLFTDMVKNVNKIEDIYDASIYVFLNMSKNQFFTILTKEWGDL